MSNNTLKIHVAARPVAGPHPPQALQYPDGAKLRPMGPTIHHFPWQAASGGYGQKKVEILFNLACGGTERECRDADAGFIRVAVSL